MLSFNSSQNALPNVSQCLTGLLRNTDQQSFSLCRQWFVMSPREASNAIEAIRRRLTPYFFADGDVSVEKVAEEVARTEFSLAKSHWRLASEISNQTFFENNYGFSSDELLESPAHYPLLTAATTTTSPSGFSHLFLRRNVQSPQLSFARGFKTKRGATEGRSFLRRSQEFRTASETDGKPAAAAAETSQSKTASSGRAEVSGKTPGRLWDGINKLASVLVIGAILVSFLQVFGVTFRVIRGGNEISPQDIDVTFDDVKGCDEAKRELQEIVDFLTNPEKFGVLGGKLPRGCLLVGPPGTGKTLLARAVAGEAGVPFFHAVGSEFDEVLVGQGARRVRDLFKTAKKRAPCVIFIDEIDSVGGKRSSSVLHPYANQTINQLLSEMDGFVVNEGIIVLGASNRSEDLDRALLRPGRFDTQVIVAAPDLKGRKEILQHYLAKIKHDASVDLDKLAKMTVGFTGADLENMVNTSAIRAATDGKEWVTMAEFEYSHDKHRMGTDWKSRVRDKDDLKITAFHEAGHTLVAYFTQDADPIHKVTIVAKGMTGGHTAFLPEKDQHLLAKAQYTAMIDVCMGGRAAEELIFGQDRVTGGASQDLISATNTAEAMVKKLGMSDRVGLRVIPDKDGFGQGPDLSTTTTETIDSEVKKLLDESYARATSLLKAHRRELDSLAEALLNHETLDAEDVKAIIEGNPKAVARKMSVAGNGAKARQSVLPVGQQPPLSGADVLA